MNATTAELRVRPAEPRDQDRLLVIHEASYPDGRDEGERWRRLTSAPFGTLADLRVVEDRDRGIVGHGFVFPLETMLGGRRVSLGGIASIGVAPEARRTGVARVLLDALHAELVARRIPLALLYPFRESFYERFGYAPTTRLAELELSAASLSRFDPPPRPVALDGRHREEVARLYASVAAERPGWLARTSSSWDARFSEDRTHWVGIFDADRALSAYVAFSYQGRGGRGRGRIAVSDFVARGHDDARSLLGFFGQQRDQIERIALTVPAADPLVHCALDGAAPGSADGRSLGSLRTGPMVRLNDACSALAGRGYAADGEIVIRIVHHQDVHSEHGESVRLRVHHGRATAEPSSEAAHLSVTRSAMAALVVSAISVQDTARLGRAMPHAQDAIARLDSLLGDATRFHCPDRF